MKKLSDEDIADFGDLIAEIVGDYPESVSMGIDRRLREITDAAASEVGRLAVGRLVEVTWPAQAEYILSQKQKGSEGTIAELLSDESMVDVAVEAVDKTISEWTSRSGLSQ